MKISAAWRWMWGRVVWFVEDANIVPFMVLVSTWHYAGALIGKDAPPVAITLGVLIDLGQYRSVREYFRSHGAGRLIVMIVLTGMTTYYHWLWYMDIWLAATMPAMIVCLALLSKWGGWAKQGKEITQPVAIATAERPQSETPAKPSETFTAHCQEPGCSWSHNSYKTAQAAQNAQNAHMKIHAKEHQNG